LRQKIAAAFGGLAEQNLDSPGESLQQPCCLSRTNLCSCYSLPCEIHDFEHKLQQHKQRISDFIQVKFRMAAGANCLEDALMFFVQCFGHEG